MTETRVDGAPGGAAPAGTPSDKGAPPSEQAAIPPTKRWFDQDFAEGAEGTATIETCFGKVSRKELEDVLTTLRQHAQDNGKEASTALRQLCLGGLAVAWLYKVAGPDAAGAIELSPDLLWPVVLLIAGLAADAFYWGVNAVYWGLDKRFHLRYKLGRFDDLGMSFLTQTEFVHGIPAIRPRFAPYLIGLEVVFTISGLVLLLRFLVSRTLF